MQIDSNSTDGRQLERLGAVRLLDLAPRASDLLSDACEGLRRRPKTLPCKYFYDARGSELFERITELAEYYPTRTELAIMDAHAAEMAEAIGPRAWLVEFGSGSGLKTERLLAALDAPTGCVLVDISKSALVASAQYLSRRFAPLDVLAICADYTQPFGLPEPPRGAARITGYFPGSTIGNFTPREALSFLRRVHSLVGPRGSLLIGIDRVKPVDVLEAAYNDAHGVTAQFNLNLLRRLRSAGAHVSEESFEHRAIYNRKADRIEMHLVSRGEQTLEIAGELFQMAPGESICTEHSHKYRLDDFAKLADEAGFALDAQWSDDRDWFSVCHLVAR